MSAAPTTRFNPHPQVLLTEMGDGTGVLLHLETKFYYTLNATGVVVWKALGDAGCRTPEALAARVSAEFEVRAEVAVRDVALLLDEMANEGLVSGT